MEVSGKEARCRIKNAVEVAQNWGFIDGDHHKTWVVDQMMRKLLGPIAYDRFRLENPDWEEGIPP